MPGHYGEKKKKKRPSAGMRTGSFPTPPKPKAPKPPRTPRTAEPRTGSFPIPKRKPTGAKAMKAATLALLKKKKKK